MLSTAGAVDPRRRLPAAGDLLRCGRCATARWRAPTPGARRGWSGRRRRRRRPRISRNAGRARARPYDYTPHVARGRRILSNAVAHATRTVTPCTTPSCSTTSTTWQQQKEASALGMWVFLVTEIMFFGGLFIAYLVYRTRYFDGLRRSQPVDLDIALRRDQHRRADRQLADDGAGGARGADQPAREPPVGWLIADDGPRAASSSASRSIEYADKFEHHIVPGANFHLRTGPCRRPRSRSSSPLLRDDRAARPAHDHRRGDDVDHHVDGAQGQVRRRYYTPVEMAGLYWHFVDIVWIFLFPLLYLVERHN